MLLEEAISLMKILAAGVLVPKGEFVGGLDFNILENTNKNQQC